jgi:fatty acid desaturase
MTDGTTIAYLSPARFAKEYADLKHQVKGAGLLDRQPFYYMIKFILLLLLLGVSISICLFVKPFGFQLLNAAFLAIITTQLGLLGHAAGHRQIFQSTRKNDIVGLIAGNLLVGLDIEWWIERHNKHHSNPNQHDVDPDVYIPIIAFAPEDLQGKSKILLSFMRYQAYFFFPMLSLALIDMHINSIRYVLKPQIKYALAERLLLLLHFVLYFGLLFAHFPIWQAIIFILVHHILAGVYQGSIFAPNHKGMPVLEKDSQMDFLHRQVLTARNIHAHPVTDFWYGGLNYQIEHHLFPSMAQNKLREAQPIIRAFCLEHAISYYETNLWQSYQETLSSLHAVTAPLRQAKSFS